MLIGFHVTFLIQHSIGLDGMPRRVYEYSDVGHLELYNLISTIGSFILGAGILVTVVNVVRSSKHGVVAGPDPWKAQHARVVHDVAAAGQQLRRRPARALGRADEGHPPPGRAPAGRAGRPGPRRRPSPRSRPDGRHARHPATRTLAPAAARQVVADYLALTKPKVQSLLLLTTVTTMLVAGDPSVGLIAADVPRRLPVGGRRGRRQPLVRPRHRRPHGAHGGPAGRLGPGRRRGPRSSSAARSARCRSCELVADGQRPGRVARPAGLRRLPVLYTVWLKRRTRQNIVIGRRGGRGPAARRLGGGHGRPRRHRDLPLRHRLLLDPAALLGAEPADEGRVRQGRHPDAAGRARGDRDPPPDPALHACCSTPSRSCRSAPAASAHLPRGVAAARRRVHRRRRALQRRADRRSALRLYLFSLAYLALLFGAMVADVHL